MLWSRVRLLASRLQSVLDAREGSITEGTDAKRLTMILHSLVLQVAQPHHNLLEQASCCWFLQHCKSSLRCRSGGSSCLALKTAAGSMFWHQPVCCCVADLIS